MKYLVFCTIGLISFGFPFRTFGEAAQDQGKSASPAVQEKINPFQQALASAYMTNSELQAKVHEKQALDESVPQALAGFRPSVSVNATGGKAWSENQHVRTSGLIPESQQKARERAREETRPASASVNVEQSLYSGGGTLAAVEAAEQGVLSGRYEYLLAEQGVLIKAITAYLGVILAKRALEFNIENEKFLITQLEAVRAEVAVGEKTLTDIAQAESRLAEAAAARITAEGELEATIANYVTVIGEKPGLLISPPPVKGLPATRVEFIEIVKQSNFAIMRAVHAEKQAKSGIDAATASLLPRVDLNGSASRDLDRSSRHSRSNSATAQVRLTIPLYQQGADWSKARQASQESTRRRYEREQVLKQVVEESIKVWEEWVTAKKRVEQFQAQINYATRSRDGVLLGVKVGEFAYLHVLDAQKELLQAQVQLEKAKRDELLAQYKILQIIGSLTPEYLELPVTKYDVDQHYQDVRGQLFGF